MAIYTGDSLDKLRKEDLIPIVLSIQSKLKDKDNTVLLEVRRLNESVSKLHSELVVTKNVNNFLLTRLTTLERQCWANAQYPRRECLDIVGIPHEVSGEALEEKVLKIFGNCGCDISPDRIEACNRIGRTTDTVVVTFSKRTDCQHVWSVKKDLREITTEDFELPGNKIFFLTEACAHITKFCCLKARNFIASVKYIVFFHFW